MRLPWNFSLYWHIFIIQDFWATCACPENRIALKFFAALIYFLSFRIFEQLALALKTELPWNFSLYWYIFYHSGFLSNLRLPWKQSLIWINCFEHIFFIIQDFWATCVCPENRVCPELTVLNRFATRGGICLPEIFKTLHGNFDIHRNSQRKMEFLILIIVKKSLIWIFLCPTG